MADETQNRPFQLSFNSWLKVDFQGARVTLATTGSCWRPPDAAAVCRHAAEDRGVAGTGGIRRAQSEVNFDDDAGAKGRVPAEPSEKEHLRMLRAHQMRNRSFPAPPEAPWAKTGPDLPGGGCLVYTTSWIGEGKRKPRLTTL